MTFANVLHQIRKFGPRSLLDELTSPKWVTCTQRELLITHRNKWPACSEHAGGFGHEGLDVVRPVGRGANDPPRRALRGVLGDGDGERRAGLERIAEPVLSLVGIRTWAARCTQQG